MIRGCERLVIVCGMAHSGTTVLAWHLRQHPDIVNPVAGSEDWILEHSALHDGDHGLIAYALDSNQDKRVLLKRPWVEIYRGDWLVQQLPHAKIICCVRPFAEIAASWAKTTSYVTGDLRSGRAETRRAFYDFYRARQESVAQGAANFFWHDHPSFCCDPGPRLADLTRWLVLPAHAYDTSLVGGHDIKDVMRERLYARQEEDDRVFPSSQ